MRTKVRINLSGCDGSTNIIMAVTTTQLRFLETLSDMFLNEGGGCDPVLNLYCGLTYEEKGVSKWNGLPYSRTEPCEKEVNHSGECGRRVK